MTWAPSYASTAELAAFVRIGDSVDDAQLGLALDTASRAIDQAANRQFGLIASPTARYYTARWDTRLGQWYADVDDLMTVTGLVVAFDETEDQTYAGTITAHHLQPVNAAADGRPWTQLYVRATSTVTPSCLADGLKVTARWGWTEVPDPVKQACLLQASRLLARRDSPFGVAGSPEVGSEVRLLARLDADVAVAVRPYRRMWGAV